MKKNIFACLLFCLFLVLPLYSVLAGPSIPSQAAGLPSANVKNILENFLQWFFGVFGILALISFIVAGIMYLTAAGSDSQAEKAKKAMTYAIIGVVVALSGFVILQAIDIMLSANDSRF